LCALCLSVLGFFVCSACATSVFLDDGSSIQQDMAALPRFRADDLNLEEGHVVHTDAFDDQEDMADEDHDVMFGDAMALNRMSFTYAHLYPFNLDAKVALVNGTGTYEQTYRFRTGANRSIADFAFEPLSSNESVLMPADVSVAQIDQGNFTYNITVHMEFNRSVGITNFALNVTDRLKNKSTVSKATRFTVIGLMFFRPGIANPRMAVGGYSASLDLSISDLLANNLVYLNAFIQYPDGKTSATALEASTPLSDVRFAFSGLDNQFVFDARKCPSDSGNFNGLNVIHPAGCGIGFSTNPVSNSYVGPQLGFDFDPSYNGSFGVLFIWDELVAGTDLEADGYETFLMVNIVGPTTPIVESITPAGPFGSTGTEQNTVRVIDLPAKNEPWQFELSVYFGPGITRNATFVSSSDDPFSLATDLTFILPPGVGKNIPWTLYVTNHLKQQDAAADGTNPPYLFTFLNSVIITSLNPNRGTVDGGTIVTAIGSFLGFNTTSSSSYVSVGNSNINNTDFLSYNTTAIVFRMPPESILSGGTNLVYNLTVSIGLTTSLPKLYTFLNPSFIEQMVPDSGPVQGGTLVTLIGSFEGYGFDGSSIRFGNTTIPDALIVSFNSTAIVFRTPSLSAVDPTSTTFRHPVIVVIDRKPSNSVEFIYQAPAILVSMSPVSGPEKGGTEVSLRGQFITYPGSNPAVLFDGQSIPQENILLWNDTNIIFRTVPRRVPGPDSYTVSVGIGDHESNGLVFTYELSYNVSIDPSGGYLDVESGNYIFGACSETVYQALVPNEVLRQNATFRWALMNQAGTKNLFEGSEIFINSNILVLPYDFLQATNRLHTLSVALRTRFSSSNATLKLIQVFEQSIGVKVLSPGPVSPSYPNVTLRIQADITLPAFQCINRTFNIPSLEISYIWQYQDGTFPFSYLNKSGNSSDIGPTLLGREFNVPQSTMQYGTSNLSLTAFFTESPEIRGWHSIGLEIVPGELQPIINTGLTQTHISDLVALNLTAANSFDPDIRSGDRTAGLQYEWGCRYAWDQNFINAATCDSQLLPKPFVRSFSISPDNLFSVRNTTNVYIQYNLTVSKDSKNSSKMNIFRISRIPSTAVFVLPAAGETRRFESLASVSVSDKLSAPIDPGKVKYYNDVIISPVSDSPETSWTFSVVRKSGGVPLSRRSQFIPYPGFWDPLNTNPGRTVLGIAAGTLNPSSTYKIIIKTSRTGFVDNEEVIEITTIGRITVEFSPTLTLSGSTQTTFIASAHTLYSGNYQYFFSISDEQNATSCVAGCQGQPTVFFRITYPGIYNIRCDVYDPEGFTLVAQAQSPDKINVTWIDAPSSLTDFKLRVPFVEGDHATLQQLGLDMVKYALANVTQASAADNEAFTSLVDYFGHIVSNSVPTSSQSASFVRLAASLQILPTNQNFILPVPSLYSLVNICVDAVLRTPDNVALQQLDNLLDFFSLAPLRAKQSFITPTSSRRRLLQNAAAPPTINFLLLDSFEIAKFLVPLVALRQTPCGFSMVATTNRTKALGALSAENTSTTRALTASEELWSGRAANPAYAAATYNNPSQKVLAETQFGFIHSCNPEQGNTVSVMTGNSSSESTFTWCREMYGDGIQDLSFTVVNTPDYIYQSDIRRNTTLTQGLTSIYVAGKGAGISFSNVSIPQSNCLKLNLKIPSSVVPSQAKGMSLIEYEVERPQQCRFGRTREWNQTYLNTSSSPFYRCEFDPNGSISFSPTSDTSYSSAIFSTNKTGMYTIATKYAWNGGIYTIDGLQFNFAEIFSVTITFFVLIAGATIAGWLLATRLIVDIAAAPPVEANFTYVERDVYGRGTAIEVDQGLDQDGDDEYDEDEEDEEPE
jgi:REJ domain/IPT/TIG domain